MRIGVLGCGYWGSKHLRVLQHVSEVDQVVAIDSREDRLLDLRRSFPSLPLFRDLASALQHVDALVIATPPSTHLSLALQGLRAGKHVLVEKPMTTSTANARRLIDEAETASLTLMVGHTFEYNAAVWKLRDVITSGELGDVYYINTARLRTTSRSSITCFAPSPQPSSRGAPPTPMPISRTSPTSACITPSSGSSPRST
jgi:predicted dehydrogenase